MDTDDDHPKSVEKTLAAAKNYSDCPVCFNTLTPPIYQCCNGHIICSTCAEQIHKCVECRVPLLKSSKIRNIALEKIINNLCVDCLNKNEGCEVKTTIESLNTHLQCCPFTPFNLCANLLGRNNCTCQVNDWTVLSHLEECHNTTTVKYSTFRLCLNLYKYPKEGESGYHFEPLVVTSLAVPLLIRSVVSGDGYFTFSGMTLKSGNDDQQNIRIKFRIESQTKKASFEWSGFTQSYRTFKETNIINSFRISVKSLLEFLGPNERPEQINLDVFVWERSNLSQEAEKIHEVHIFEQRITDSEVIHANNSQAQNLNVAGTSSSGVLTATTSGLQSVNSSGTSSVVVDFFLGLTAFTFFTFFFLFLALLTHGSASLSESI